MDREQTNQAIKDLCKESKGVFQWADQVGADGLVYTYFEPAKSISDIEPGQPFVDVSRATIAIEAPTIVNGLAVVEQVVDHGDQIDIVFPGFLARIYKSSMTGKLLFRERSTLGAEYILTFQQIEMILQHYANKT